MTTLETVCDDYWYPNLEASNHVTTKVDIKINKTEIYGFYRIHMEMVCVLYDPWNYKKNPLSVSKFTFGNNVYFEGKD